MNDDAFIPSCATQADLELFRKGSRMGGRLAPGDRPALLVVDMTRGFIEPEFPQGCGALAERAAGHTREVLEVARERGIPVFFTMQCSRATAVERGSWGYKFTEVITNDPMDSPEGLSITPLLAPRAGEPIIVKAKPSAFFGTQLASMLIHERVDTLVVTGLVTSGCVRATVVDAFSYNYKVIVPMECVADRAAFTHEVSLFDIDQKYGNVCTRQEVIDYFRRVGSPSLLRQG